MRLEAPQPLWKRSAASSSRAEVCGRRGGEKKNGSSGAKSGVKRTKSTSSNMQTYAQLSTFASQTLTWLDSARFRSYEADLRMQFAQIGARPPSCAAAPRAAMARRRTEGSAARARCPQSDRSTDRLRREDRLERHDSARLAACEALVGCANSNLPPPL